MKNEQQKTQVLDWIEKFPNSGAELIANGTGIFKLQVFKILKTLSDEGKITINEKGTNPPYSIVQNSSGRNQPIVKPIAAEKTKTKTAEITGRDTSKLSFQGKQFGKGQLVLAVIREHVAKNPTITLEELKEQFPDSLQPRYGTIKEVQQAKKLSVDRDRFFLKPEQVFSVGNKKVAVSNQWGINNITPFISAAKKLGYKIR